MLRTHTLLKKLKSQRGFTIIELLVTIGIVVLVTGIVMIRYSSFNSSVLLTSQGYITAFDLREAQSLAVSVRGNSSNFREEYGIFFNSATPNEYLLFQDNDANGDHSPARYHSGEAIAAAYKVDSRFSIVDICGTNGGTTTCGLSDLAVTFKRPDFDAQLYSSSLSNLTSAEIHFGNGESSLIKRVIIYGSGQIAVE